MMSHEAFVFLSYAATAVTLGGLLAGILLDGRARRRELAELETQGVRLSLIHISEPTRPY